MSEKVPLDKLIRIIVPRRSGQSEGGFSVGASSGKGANKMRRSDEFLPRRVRSQFVNFWDLGLIDDGGEIADLTFSRPKNWAPAGAFPDIFPPSKADYDALAAHVLTPGTAALESSYARVSVERAEHNIIFVSADSQFIAALGDGETAPAWAASGWKAPPEYLNATTLEILSGREMFHNFKLKGAGARVTTTNDYNGTVVAFTPTATDKFYLVPRLSIVQAQANANDPGENDTLITDYRTSPRLPFTTPGSPIFGFPQSIAWSESENTDADYQPTKTLIAFINDPAFNPIAVRVDHMFGYFRYTALDPATFPRSDVFGASPSPRAFSLAGGFGNFHDAGHLNILAAIVRQGENFFYVWK